MEISASSPPVPVVGALFRLQIVLPGAGDLRWQAQRADARREGFDPGPEQAGQGGGDRVQAGVVQRGLPFPQVVHDQVADRLAPQPVAVDEFLDGQLALGQPERPDGGRGVGGEDAQGAQPQVEVDLFLPAAGVHPALGVGQLHAVPDRDVADEAALAGQQGRDPGRREPRIRREAGGPASASWRSRANPPGSRDRSHDRGQVLWVRVSIHARRAG